MAKITRLSEAEAATDIIADAFGNDAISAWLIPSARDRMPIQRRFFGMYVAHALHHGVVYGIHESGELVGAATWFTAPFPGIPGEEQVIAAFAGENAGRYGLLGRKLVRLHPQVPHHYLNFIALRPGRTGRGLGSLLLEEHHRRLDAQRMPAYLEASSADSRRLYLRHGYVDMAEPLRLPDGPVMYPMWRAPASV
ncbi:N-acetyltransferase [Sphaerisporangium krabiense]|uniref:GNAT superfamily N-acetyltransferase n=1 Tax=Sphaerisporangium krabiense TaxID=763782 RepID=A0A7W8Z445_9ACTN|nr:GNAT family N-acetyltransferase [Sphaerisporangium krabiense]MBB5627091.1 GNAT superfamily N-acetyltransferase [Sphaerisporangium krabiense]GII65247.1 N-acetyltransferase [Sphaerisporangium krabiense]